MAKFLLNGRPGEALPLTDRAVHYGDGLFETIAVNGGKPLCWPQHMQRLARGCGRLGMTPPPAALLRGEADQLLPSSGRAVLKIIVSRGSGGRGYLPPVSAEPTRLLGLYPWPDYPDDWYRNGLACTLATVRLGRNPALAGLKHLNRLEQVLARADVAGRGYSEGLMLDTDGNVIEGTMSNLFLVRGTDLITPDLDQCGVAGIIRHVVLERALEWGLRPHIENVRPENLQAADELFLCNSILGVCPLTQLDQQNWPAGTVTRSIMDSLVADGQVAGP